MIALNIAIYFSNNVNEQLKNLQNNISNNLINFNKERVPHITLIQFFCDNTNIEKINTYVQNMMFHFQLFTLVMYTANPKFQRVNMQRLSQNFWLQKKEIKKC